MLILIRGDFVYIKPGSKIYILKDVPLDNTYQHTIYFSSKSAQESYFAGKSKYKLTAQSYQRLQRGFSAVNINANDIYDCNYIMFQNTPYGNKWFYGFINSVEYVNDNMSTVSFEIDVMQTWFFDYELGECFVEREHSKTDEIGDNIIDEEVDTGEYVVKERFETGLNSNGYCAVVASIYDKDYQPFGGTTYQNIFSGLCYIPFDIPSQGEELVNYILNDNFKRDAVVCIFMMPKKLVEIANNSAQYLNVQISRPTDFQGYVPRNNKLFTYPYSFLYVSDMSGHTAEYRYEFFDKEAIPLIMRIKGDYSPACSATIYPAGYLQGGFDCRFTISGWPQCAFSSDTYRAWLAQNGSSLAINTAVSSATSGLSAAGTANPFKATAAITNLFGNVFSTMAAIKGRSSSPLQNKGSQGSSLMMALGELDFYVTNKTITAKYARIIDDYFDMFGYATHEVKVPNRNVRPHWCYTKTVGCVATGSVPGGDMNKICSIYDNGITFWKNGSEIGNYSLDNRV